MFSSASKNKMSSKRNAGKAANNARNNVAGAALSVQIGSKTKFFNITDRERVLSFIPGTTAFVAQGFPCNPALIPSFPWLSGHATLYDEYMFTKLQYKWIPIKGTTFTGNVIMGFDRDAQDAPPASGVQMCSLNVYQSGAVWDDIILNVPIDDKWRYCRTGPTAGDIKTFDFGALYVSTEGTSDSILQGYVECSYTISFKEKNIPNSGSGNVYTVAAFSGDNTIDAVLNLNSFRFNSGQIGYTPGGLYNVVSFVDAASGTVFTLPKGVWRVLAKVNINNVALLTSITAGGSAPVQTIYSQGTGPTSIVLEVIAKSSGSDTLFIQNTGGATVLSSRNYSSISFSLIE